MMFGYDAGVLAGVQSTEPFLSAIGHPERDSTVIIPMIASSYTLGAWVMSMVISFIGAPLGRRNCILFGNILVLIGGTLQASTFSVAQIIVGRVLCVRIVTFENDMGNLEGQRLMMLLARRASGLASFHPPSRLTWFVSPFSLRKKSLTRFRMKNPF